MKFFFAFLDELGYSNLAILSIKKEVRKLPRKISHFFSLSILKASFYEASIQSALNRRNRGGAIL